MVKRVEFSYSGAEPDMIIAVGVSDLESLDSVYLGYGIPMPIPRW